MVVTLAAVLVVALLEQPAAQQRADVERAYAQVLDANSAAALRTAIAEYKAALPRAGSFYVMEGDLLRTDKEVTEDLVFARAQGARIQQERGPELLIALRPDGGLDYWADPNLRTLTYSIDRRSFSSPAQTVEVEMRLRAAATDWENVCDNCGVKFVLREDARPSHQRSTFIVRQFNSGGSYIAASFFPSYASNRRYLNIDPSFFTTTFDRTGVLRHEVGHILGYRHEHIQSIPGCYREGDQWRPLTAYDPKSVMHYICGGGGTRELSITDLDKQGHTGLYRPRPSA